MFLKLGDITYLSLCFAYFIIWQNVSRILSFFKKASIVFWENYAYDTWSGVFLFLALKSEAIIFLEARFLGEVSYNVLLFMKIRNILC